MIETPATVSMSLESTLAAMARHLFDRYLRQPRLPQAVLRLAHATGLMPKLADSIVIFSGTLANVLRARDDIDVEDPALAAWVMTSTAIGVVHALLWTPELPFPRADLEREVAAMWRGYLVLLGGRVGEPGRFRAATETSVPNTSK